MKRMDYLEHLMGKLINAQLKTDAQLAKTDTQLAKTDTQLAKTDAQLAKTDAQLAKTDAQLAKTDAQLAKTDAQLAKTNAQLAKTDAQLSKTDKSLNRATELLGNMGMNLGAVAEEFFYEALKEKKILGNIKFDEVVCNIKTKIKKTEDKFDIVMYNGASIALIEIKHKVHPNDLITLYTTKIENFRLLYPAYKNHNIYLGIGGFSVPSSVEQQAHSRGIAVLKQKADVAVIDVKKLKIY